MKSIMIGFESAGISNGTVQSIVGPVPADMILRGYHLDVAIVPIQDPGFFASYNPSFAEILFYGVWTPSVPQGWTNGAAIMPVVNRSIVMRAGSHIQPIGPATGVASDSTFAAAILKAHMPNPVNKSLDASGLALTIPAGSYIVFEADHMGYPVDFELQGVLFYD